jgi:ADP-ribose pyrophosphatase
MASAILFAKDIPHVKARISPYLGGTVRAIVPDECVPWSSEFPKGYSPVEYTAGCVLAAPVWADPNNAFEIADEFNKVGKKDRTSFEGKYNLEPETSRPINPKGRTGMTGRGLLGRYGPNHAADPIVTRFARDSAGNILHKDGNPIIECVLIKRADNGEWAIPGGMVEAGNTVSLTLKKEFGEEAMGSIEATAEKRAEIQASVQNLFASGGNLIYRGYVDDPRNTDNAWMETVAVNFHDADGTSFATIPLNAGDDAVGVKWVQLEPGMKLYASHTMFIEMTYMSIIGVPLV